MPVGPGTLHPNAEKSFFFLTTPSFYDIVYL